METLPIDSTLAKPNVRAANAACRAATAWREGELDDAVEDTIRTVLLELKVAHDMPNSQSAQLVLRIAQNVAGMRACLERQYCMSSAEAIEYINLGCVRDVILCTLLANQQTARDLQNAAENLINYRT